ncbi:uncharacterized protein LOC131429248 [Malaya genurostris]|uniref:uncharacterized protein LOC131429248 n=1 Tax=Malaya genurostris TaxID=325434 RepID=UPI0026F3DCA0|nr:uncharacterized protein LOC131429248 [Malaya genurostris]
MPIASLVAALPPANTVESGSRISAKTQHPLSGPPGPPRSRNCTAPWAIRGAVCRPQPPSLSTTTRTPPRSNLYHHRPPEHCFTTIRGTTPPPREAGLPERRSLDPTPNGPPPATITRTQDRDQEPGPDLQKAIHHRPST